jgi:hypothetical protein
VADFWIGSQEWGRWWDAEPATVVRRIPTDGERELTLAELDRTGEHVLLGRHVPAPLEPGRAVGVVVYHAPDGWDERSPVREADLRFASEPELYARQEEAPVVSAEYRERVRRGWA